MRSKPTAFRREHEDSYISILSCDVPAFVAHMSGRWLIWNNGGVSAECCTR
jgi:hypothetical protein